MKTYLKSLNTAQPQFTEVKQFTTISSPAQDRHARVEFKNDQYIIKDLKSATGVFVNDIKVEEATLSDGDLIQLGDLDLVFCNETTDNSGFPIKSRNPVWNEELQSLAHVAKTNLPVLLLGASGTGKDVIAKALHEKSSRHRGPFISVNCSALTETLVESELFGHIKGSFTGAINDRKGAFEAARGGTLFLDEIGDLSYALQAKILRALENNEIRPVGSDQIVRTDVRIIAATHQNMQEKIRQGAFRSDLYFRLNVVPVCPPSLSLRMEDFDDLLYTFAREMRVRFSFNAIQQLKKHSWPGNIRELKNLVLRASALFPKQSIEVAHIEKLIDRTLVGQTEMTKTESLPMIKEIEKQMIIQKLSFYKGNQRRAAQDLGMPKSTLHDRLKYYNIDVTSFKSEREAAI